jgi:Zn-dependent peptidase ImmA (M78 family)
MVRSRRKVWKSAAVRRLQVLAGNAPSVESAIRIVAETLLADIPCPPTDLDQILPRVNVIGYEARTEFTGSGALIREGKAFKIIYSSQMLPSRKRWTLAHEVAHALFEKTGRNAPRSGHELERLCDMIATELLLPWRHFAPRIRENVCLDNVLHLARIFQTSVTATAIRCAEVCGVSAFEMESNQLRWGYGVVRTEYDIISETALAGAVSASTHSDSGGDEFDLAFGNRVGRWVVEWRHIGSADRRIFLLRKIQ